MICYVFNVRRSKYTSKKDNKKKDGWNVSLVCLEGSKFHLETFIDDHDEIFPRNPKADLSKVFCPGFWDVDIYEFESRNEQGISIYQKRISKILGHLTLEDAKPYLEPNLQQKKDVNK